MHGRQAGGQEGKGIIGRPGLQVVGASDMAAGGAVGGSLSTLPNFGGKLLVPLAIWDAIYSANYF